MALTVGRNIVAPFLFLNLFMYSFVVGFASWCLNRFINGQANNHPGFGGNGATMFFLIFAILAGVVGVVSKLTGGCHIREWRNESHSAAASSALIDWAITALAFGFACKEIHIGGYRGWRLKALEAFIIILTFTQLLYLHWSMLGSLAANMDPGIVTLTMESGHRVWIRVTRVVWVVGLFNWLVIIRRLMNCCNN